MKVCYKCKIEQPIKEFKFYVNDTKNHSYCNTCRKKQSKFWRDKYHEDGRRINYEYKRAYGISYERYKIMCVEQDYRCKICNQITELFVDHDHKTKRIRGLLCRKCNLGIGYLEDNIDTLNSAIIYLQGED